MLIDTTGSLYYERLRVCPATLTKEREMIGYLDMWYAPRDPLMYLSDEAKRTDGASTTFIGINQ